MAKKVDISEYVELSIPEAAAFLGVTAMTFRNWRQNPSKGLPKPLSISPKKTRFLQHELIEWKMKQRGDY